MELFNLRMSDEGLERYGQRKKNSVQKELCFMIPGELHGLSRREKLMRNKYKPCSVLFANACGDPRTLAEETQTIAASTLDFNIEIYQKE